MKFRLHKRITENVIPIRIYSTGNILRVDGQLIENNSTPQKSLNKRPVGLKQKTGRRIEIQDAQPISPYGILRTSMTNSRFLFSERPGALSRTFKGRTATSPEWRRAFDSPLTTSTLARFCRLASVSGLFRKHSFQDG